MEDRNARLGRFAPAHLRSEVAALYTAANTLRDSVEPLARGRYDETYGKPSELLRALAGILDWGLGVDPRNAKEIAYAVATLVGQIRGLAQEPVEAAGGRDALACYRETGEIDPADSLRATAKEIRDWASHLPSSTGGPTQNHGAHKCIEDTNPGART